MLNIILMLKDFQVVMYDLLAKSGIGSDVVSGGELYAALKGGMDPQELNFMAINPC